MIFKKAKSFPIHYGWIIVVTGTLCIFACLGLGRFALGMLLPSMAATLKLSYAQMGYISTGNFVGYLIAVFLVGNITQRFGARETITAALFLVGISMILMGMINSFVLALLLYFLTGIGSGASNVPMMGLVSAWFEKRIRGKAAGFIVIGSGFAIIFSGKLIPFINAHLGSEGWRTSWLVLGIIVIVVALLCLFFLRNSPNDVGLKPVGEEKGKETSQGAGRFKDINIYKSKVIYHLGIIYFLFGYTYVIYATFIVTTLVKERGFPESVAGNFWSAVGLFSLLSGPVFGTLSDKLGRKAGLLIVFSFQLISYLLVATKLPGIFLYLSIFFFGVVAWSIPSIMAAAVGDYVGPEKAPKAFGFITFIFGLGQITGPSIAGILAEKSGSFTTSFYMAAIFAGLAILLTCFLKKPS